MGKISTVVTTFEALAPVVTRNAGTLGARLASVLGRSVPRSGRELFAFLGHEIRNNPISSVLIAQELLSYSPGAIEGIKQLVTDPTIVEKLEAMAAANAKALNEVGDGVETTVRGVNVDEVGLNMAVVAKATRNVEVLAKAFGSVEMAERIWQVIHTTEAQDFAIYRALPNKGLF